MQREPEGSQLALVQSTVLTSPRRHLVGATRRRILLGHVERGRSGRSAVALSRVGRARASVTTLFAFSTLLGHAEGSLVAGRVLFYTKKKIFQVPTPMPSRSTVLLAAIPSFGILLALLLAYFLR